MIERPLPHFWNQSKAMARVVALLMPGAVSRTTRRAAARTGLRRRGGSTNLRAMNYQLRGLEPAQFERFFGLDDAELAKRGMRRMRVDAPVGYPCRVTLEDAPVGEEVLLLPYTHQETDSPYRASGPIFVRRGIAGARRITGALPPYLTTRLLSVRAYDNADMMVTAEVVEGAEADPLFRTLLTRPDVSYLHVHFAKRGCFGVRVERA